MSALSVIIREDASAGSRRDTASMNEAGEAGLLLSP